MTEPLVPAIVRLALAATAHQPRKPFKCTVRLGRRRRGFWGEGGRDVYARISTPFDPPPRNPCVLAARAAYLLLRMFWRVVILPVMAVTLAPGSFWPVRETTWQRFGDRIIALAHVLIDAAARQGRLL